MEPSLERHTLSKVKQWAFYLSRFDYIIDHVRSEDNVFADILTQWARGYRQAGDRQAMCSLVLTEAQQIVPRAESFPWPDMEAVRRSQLASARDIAKMGLSKDCTDGLWKRNGRRWIPSEDLDLQLKLLVTSHRETIGHRGRDATMSIILEGFWCSSIKQDTSEFVGLCLHRMITRAGKVIPRPMSHALHGERPNEVLHADFLYMGSGTGGQIYVLIIRDDLSEYEWLGPAKSASAEAASKAFCQWLGVFGDMSWLVTDQGSHFKNWLMKQLTEETHIGHHFTTAYCP